MRLTRTARAGLVVLLAALVTGTQAGVPTALSANPLGKDLDAVLSSPSLAGADIGLVVRKASTGEVLYTRQSDRRRQPASNTKLFTAAAALDTLGPGYRFRTTVESAAHRAGPVLAGDLVLRGGGDPTVLAADYDALAAKIAASGVKVVTGKLVADDGFFDRVRLGTGWAWDDEPYYYNAQTSALTIAPDTDFDAGSVIVRVSPGQAGKPAKVDVVPPNSYVRVVNTATTAPNGSAAVAVDREHGTNTITVSGSIPVGAAPDEETMAVWEPTGLASSVFRDALSHHGVRVLGASVTSTAPKQPVLASRDSIGVSDLLTPFLKLSNNMHAEALVKAASRGAGGSGGWTDGLAALEKALPSLDVDPSRLSFVDGSGLSRMDQATPDQIAALLLAARGKPWFDRFYAALPVAGVADRLVGGTLRSRLVGTAAAGKVHAKTGSYTGVSALSGYVTAADGEELVFSMVSNQTLGSPRKAEDAVALRLAQYAGASDRSQPAVQLTERSQVDSPRDELECSWTKTC
ncbi:D-alanyl-D-alanine carboxypeptidase/D-alanyl-D-alanine endopeptidase [Amycolatopsis sp. CA-230715]|uniref:D-alanyl-D-alanine carboxypeptidase/D-alanyl-D-alanine endopeptidase n=1 Tax=Amycolatopsis sp. CA-230715 TaxID=2745196 RepID=UPI001C00ECEE|nr:D-alanyl-D-alanine carboxypeptidase/D-alanyl-D-alanine-endopeptidase [Amycolatopsis sp. CA-230715]QWF77517.1 D-alanyl-D-alanine carboxypeptidase [Amycolatopsis sp. CA-230715]